MLKLDATNFEKEVLNYQGTVIVDFWAEWCGPCRMLAPELEAFAEENTEIKVGKVNIDEETPLAIKYRVEVIPTLIVFKDGKEVNRSMGYVRKEEIKSLI